MNDTLVVAHRRATEADLPFVRDGWLETFRESHYAGPIPMDMYRKLYREVIARIIARPMVEVWVAYDAAIPTELLGFLCLERDVYCSSLHRTLPAIHYVYSKLLWRAKKGVIRGLCAAAGIDPLKPFVHAFKTADSASVVRAKKLGANWRPLFIRFPRIKEPPP